MAVVAVVAAPRPARGYRIGSPMSPARLGLTQPETPTRPPVATTTDTTAKGTRATRDTRGTRGTRITMAMDMGMSIPQQATVVWMSTRALAVAHRPRPLLLLPAPLMVPAAAEV